MVSVPPVTLRKLDYTCTAGHYQGHTRRHIKGVKPVSNVSPLRIYVLSTKFRPHQREGFTQTGQADEILRSRRYRWRWEGRQVSALAASFRIAHNETWVILSSHDCGMIDPMGRRHGAYNLSFTGLRMV
jgi:hypothetical protein